MVTSVPWQLRSTEGKDLARLDQDLSRAPARGPRSRGGDGSTGEQVAGAPDDSPPPQPDTGQGQGPAAGQDPGPAADPDERLAVRP
jgi:hypothetical protein